MKITLEFSNADDATRLMQQVQAGNESIIGFLERWSAKREEFMAENKQIHFHGNAHIHGSVAVGDHIAQTGGISRDEIVSAFTAIRELLTTHLTDSSDIECAKTHLSAAVAELEEPEPDPNRIAKRTAKLTALLKHLGGGSKWFNDVTKCASTIAEYCGKYGAAILQVLS